MSLNPHIDKDITGTYWLRWTRPPDVARYDIITPAGKHVQAGPNAIESKLGSQWTEPVIASIAPIFNSDYERAEFPRPPQSIAIGVPTAGASGVAVFDKVVVGGGSTRVDLRTKATNYPAMIAWLKQNPQPAVLDGGEWTFGNVIEWFPGIDIEYRNVALYPTNVEASAHRLVTGGGHKISFLGDCRIGRVGTRTPRKGQAEAAAIITGNDSGPAHDFTIHADDLIMEGVGQDAFYFYRGPYNGKTSGKFHAINTGADSFHHTGGAHHIDHTATTLITDGGGDDMFAVVSYGYDFVLCHDIHWGTCIGRNCPARGMSVVGGGPNITMDSLDVDGCDAAGIYIACEAGDYNTLGVDGVLVKQAKIRNCSRQIHNANVLFYSSRSGYSLKNAAVTVNDPDTSKALWRKTGVYSVSNCTVNGQVVS